MKYMAMISASETNGAFPPLPPALMQAIMEFGEEAMKAGVLVEQGGLLPSSTGARIRLSKDGDITLQDGPFAESKEVVGGFAVYEVPTREEAMKWVRRFVELHKQHWPGWEGTCEIRQMMNQG
jgi:hypothetical protein